MTQAEECPKSAFQGLGDLRSSREHFEVPDAVQTPDQGEASWSQP